MRKFVFTLTLTILLSFVAAGFAEAKTTRLFYDGKWHEYKVQPIFLKVNGKDVKSTVPPVVYGDYNMVPVREVFEALGGKAAWNASKKTMTINYEDSTYVLTADSRNFKINNTQKALGIPVKLISGKLMIPPKFFLQNLGLNVDWSNKERTIYIAEKPNDIRITGIRYLSNPAKLIQKVAYTEDEKYKKVAIDIEASNEIKKYSVVELQGPNRLVVDFDNAVLDSGSKTIPVEQNGINQIRSAQNSTDPNRTRVVVDLDKPLKYKTYLTSDKKHLVTEFTVKKAPKRDKRLVVIDPGHGGNDPGAIYGLNEKDLNFDISQRLKKLLQKENIDVRMTREDDSFVDLYDRSAFANNLEADLLISIHNNAMDDPNFDGTMTLFYPDDDNPGFNNRKFAKIIQNEMLAKTGNTDRLIRERPKLAVLRTSEVPAVLVEVAVMTNEKDAKNLRNPQYLQKVAEALKDGIVKALKEEYKK